MTRKQTETINCHIQLKSNIKAVVELLGLDPRTSVAMIWRHFVNMKIYGPEDNDCSHYSETRLAMHQIYACIYA